MEETVIYLDNQATTRCDPRVLDAMFPWFSGDYGNPHSVSHVAGRLAAEAVNAAQSDLAQRIGGTADELLFTSGATESNNLALFGMLLHPRQKRRKVISVGTEHPSILDPLKVLEGQGFFVQRLSVIAQGNPHAGQVALEEVQRAIDDDTALITIMLANNEIGVLQPLTEIAEIAHQRGALVHSDATQAVGKIPIDVDRLGVDLMSFSAHKFYGPKGIGGLYVRRRERRVRLVPQIVGGGQQQGLRSGTLNVPCIIGMQTALQLCDQLRSEEYPRMFKLRQRLWQQLSNAIEGIGCNGPALENPLRLAGNLNVRLPRVEGESIMMSTPQIAISSGSACSSAEPEPSHVLLALGLSESEARCSIRFGIGRETTEKEVDQAVALLADSYAQLSKLVAR